MQSHVFQYWPQIGFCAVSGARHTVWSHSLPDEQGYVSELSLAIDRGTTTESYSPDQAGSAMLMVCL